MTPIADFWLPEGVQAIYIISKSGKDIQIEEKLVIGATVSNIQKANMLHSAATALEIDSL